jgi:hypothetical protein
MYAERHSDELLLRLNDTRQLWQRWNPKKGDKIKVEDGNAKTGTMFIDSVTPSSGFLTLRAYSMPPTVKDKRSKSWEQVKFLQLVNEIAETHGLTVLTYGLQDQTYKFVTQNNEPDFDFLYKRCILEGVAFLVFDEQIILYSQSAQEGMQAGTELKITNGYDFEYKDNGDKAFGSCEVKNGSTVGTFSSDAGKKALKTVLPLAMSSEEEANRFAKNLLRDANKNMTTATIYTEYMARDIAPGSNVTLNTEGASGWDGKAFVTQVRHDYVKTKSKIWLRKPLEGY